MSDQDVTSNVIAYQEQAACQCKRELATVYTTYEGIMEDFKEPCLVRSLVERCQALVALVEKADEERNTFYADYRARTDNELKATFIKINRLRVEITRLCKVNAKSEDKLARAHGRWADLRWYLDQTADVVDGCDGPRPNLEMRILSKMTQLEKHD